MAIEKLNIEQFIQLLGTFPVLDVRSPGEFNHAHIPGALNLPLFTDEERKVVGTAYKQQNRQTAIKIGLGFFGIKTVDILETVEKIVEDQNTRNKVRNNKYEVQILNSNEQIINRTSKTVLVHCWRGGMRSAAIAWLLDLYGFKVYTLVGGYKAFRNWVLKQFEKEYPFAIVGGYTGSSKTNVLTALKKQGETVIDLEELAHHKGSAFGSLGELPQPSQEMFENKLAIQLGLAVDSLHLVKGKPDKHQPTTTNQIWLEDESQRIGNVNIPNTLFGAMRRKNIFFLEIPFEERLDNIVMHYGKFEKDKLLTAIVRIKKRLGGLETKTAVNFLLEDDTKKCFEVLLKYYDKWYLKGLHNRENLSEILTIINCPTVDAKTNTEILIQSIKKKNNQ